MIPKALNFRKHSRDIQTIAMLVVLPHLAVCLALLLTSLFWLRAIDVSRQLESRWRFVTFALPVTDAFLNDHSGAVMSRLAGDRFSQPRELALRTKAVDMLNALMKNELSEPALEYARQQVSELLQGNLRSLDKQPILAPENVHSVGEMRWYLRARFMSAVEILDLFRQHLTVFASRLTMFVSSAEACVYAAAAICVLLTLCAPCFFARTIGKRLRVLVENMAQMSHFSSMKTIDGWDEVSLANRKLQEIGQQIGQARQEHTDLLSTLGHGVGDAVSTANQSLKLIEHSSLPQGEKELRRSISAIRINLRAVLRFVEDMLAADNRASKNPNSSQFMTSSPIMDGLTKFPPLANGMTRRLLLLLCISLCVQLIYLSLIAFQINETWSRQQHIEKHSALILNCDEARVRLHRAVSALIVFVLTRDADMDRLWQADLDHAEQLFLQNLPETPLKTEKAYLQKYLAEIAIARKYGIMMNERHLRVVTGPNIVDVPEVIGRLEDYDADWEILQEIHFKLMAEDMKQLNAELSAVKITIWLGLPLELLLAALVAWAFDLWIARPISWLALWRADVKIPFHCSSSDEVGLLCTTVIEAQQILSSLDEERRFQISRLDHNITSPLDDAAKALGELTDASNAAVPPDLTKQLETAKASIESALQTVHNLS